MARIIPPPEPTKPPPLPVLSVATAPLPITLLNIRRLICPRCTYNLATYGTQTRGVVVVRYHRCGHCGATSIRTEECSGVLRFVGWAQRQTPQIAAEVPTPTQSV